MVAVVNLANTLTAGRLLLFFAFLLVVKEGWVYMGMFLFSLAWGLDAVDGYLARTLHERTTFGFFFDKIVDRIIIVGGIVFLWLAGLLPATALFLLAKDVVLLPMLTMHIFARKQMVSTGWPGKLVTVLQGAAILWLLFGFPASSVVVVGVAALGAVVGVRHLYRVLTG
jgi:cardiolipin synthase